MRRSLNIFLAVLLLMAGCRKDDTVRLEPVPKAEGGKMNVILMIGDGMGMPQITAARTVSENGLNMLTCPVTGIQSTHSADEYVTDSGAAGTAIACGEKTNHYTVGVDVDGQPLTSIVESLEEQGLSTGLITTTQIMDATPAAFFAHQNDRFAYEPIAMELIGSGIDYLMGGGRKYLDQRTDGLNLIDSLITRGYQVAGQPGELGSSTGKAAIFIADDAPPAYLGGRGEVLTQAVEQAIQMLRTNPKGFFLMVEGGQIDWACENNDQDYLLAEMLDFDRAVGKALEYAHQDGNTLVIITGDHETGGYTLVGGDEQAHTVNGQFLTYQHTGTMIPVLAGGPGATAFSGVYENTGIYDRMAAFFGLEK
ncbi:MAG: alkaline phosphatase [Bacteroidales bacterium]|nr:alkaline phosphatase [Bacteroidales bacterium]